MSRPDLMRMRIDLAYDGTDFTGWARQPGLRTVQETLEVAIARLLRLESAPTLTVAGRTDAGVHARVQVAHLDLDPDISVAVRGEHLRGPAAIAGYLAHRLPKVLSPDVVVHGVREAPAGFDARFSAIWRRYCYRIWDRRSQPDPLMRHQVASLRATLDPEAMNEAAQALLGLHDFAAFCKPREGATTIRTLTEVSVQRSHATTAELQCWVQADAFCHSMVRSLVGALTEVGRGRRSRSWLVSLLDADRRDATIPVLPAGGLCLERVGYPPDHELATRAAEARQRRERRVR